MRLICKVCGARIGVYTDPNFCGPCYSRLTGVTPATLKKLTSVPGAYRSLVERDVLYEVPECGDFGFLSEADVLTIRENYYDLIKDNTHLQPFAKAWDGALWCWTSFRCGSSAEPEILNIDLYETVIVYAPTFETFLYRTALEDAYGRWLVQPERLGQKIQAMAKVLRGVHAAELADDLDHLVSQPIADYTPRSMATGTDRWFGFLSQSDADRRIETFLGSAYLNQILEPSALKMA